VLLGRRSENEELYDSGRILSFFTIGGTVRTERPNQMIALAFGWGNAGADFSFASSEFKALGAFFCNHPNPSPFVEGPAKNHFRVISIVYEIY
jgi:hypothetical protein